ncbi:MAG: UbiH/UbiF family hydroxylase [Rhodocyclaceae bacterium]
MDFDLLIVGGGLAGASLACALRGSRLRIALLDRAAPAVSAGWDARIYAVSPANVGFLQQCGVWQHLDAARVQRVERMAVYGDAAGAGRGQLGFSAYEAGLDALAWIVEGGRLGDELWQTARRQPNITVVTPAEPQSLEVGAAGATLSLANGQRLRAALVVGADGVNSWVRQQAGLAAEMQPYADMGLVANFACERHHAATASQWFRADGVLACLPLPGNLVSIVWSTPQAHAEALLALSAEALADKVSEASEGVLGKLELLAPAAAFPLRLMRVPEVVAPRVALIGDAAHAIHPLSGHGINLGFQDAQVLAARLLALPAFRDCGELSVLRQYERARVEEVAMLQGVTHGLHQLFGSQSAPLAWLRNAGMSLTGRLPFVRAAMTRYAAGLL